MAVAIRVPDLGTTVDEVKLLSWLVDEGEQVRRGQPIAEIETDKAVSELECVADGVLLKQMVQADQTVETGTVLAYVGQPGEPVPDEPTPAAAPAPESPPGGKAPARPAAASTPRVSPVVRNLAKKLGVDLGGVRGTGQGSRITREDVIRASRAATATSSDGSGEPLSRAQSAVARAVSTSNREIPHLRITAEIDMTAVDRIRAQHETDGTSVGYDAIFVKALAQAIHAVPLVAAHLQGQHVVRPQGIHIAVAVGFGDNLFLPVVRDVDRKDLAAVQSEIAALAAQAKGGTLKAEQMTGGCMTLSNLGMYPITSFDAIIFPEHSSILSVGAVQDKPVVVDGEVTAGRVATVRLAVDHRLINGRTAAAFLTEVKQLVEAGAIA